MASLRFKKDGTPFVDFYAHGKRHRPEFENSKTGRKDARNFEAIAENDPIEAYDLWMETLNLKNPVKTADFISFVSKVEAFKENYCSKRVRGNEMKRVMDYLVEFIKEKYGKEDVDIRHLVFEDLEELHLIMQKKGRRRKAGVSNASVNRYFSTIKTFFKRQFLARVIPVDISVFVEPLPVAEVQREAWKDGSTEKMVEKLQSENKDPVLIDIVKSNEWTPFGPMDYSRLTWAKIDFKSSMVRTIRLKGKRPREWNVVILKGYEEILKDILKRQKANGLGSPEDFVYLTSDHKPIEPMRISKALERCRKALGIKEVPYASRHRILRKVADKTSRDTARQFAGHASIRTTEKHYLGREDDAVHAKIKEALDDE